MTDQSNSDQSPAATTDASEATQTDPAASTAPTREGTDAPSVGAGREPVAVMRWVRFVAAFVLAGVALFTWFDMGESDSKLASERSSIEAMADHNNQRAEDNLELEVFNGWTTIEYLDLLSKQQEQSNNRLDALFLLALLGGSVALLTSRSNARP